MIKEWLFNLGAWQSPLKKLTSHTVMALQGLLFYFHREFFQLLPFFVQALPPSNNKMFCFCCETFQRIFFESLSHLMGRSTNSTLWFTPHYKHRDRVAYEWRFTILVSGLFSKYSNSHWLKFSIFCPTQLSFFLSIFKMLDVSHFWWWNVVILCTHTLKHETFRNVAFCVGL